MKLKRYKNSLVGNWSKRTADGRLHVSNINLETGHSEDLLIPEDEYNKLPEIEVGEEQRSPA